MDAAKFEMVPTSILATNEYSFDDELLRRTDFAGSENANIIEDIQDNWSMQESSESVLK